MSNIEMLNLILSIVLLVLILVRGTHINVEVSMKQPEAAAQDADIDEMQKKFDEEYEKEWKDAANAAEAVQKLFLDKEDE